MCNSYLLGTKNHVGFKIVGIFGRAEIFHFRSYIISTGGTKRWNLCDYCNLGFKILGELRIVENLPFRDYIALIGGAE